jgi:type VI secretion system protein ImpE
LELIQTDGEYCWMPLSLSTQIRIQPPAKLRDLVWSQAGIMMPGGQEARAIIPTRYPGTESSKNDELRLCKRTEWLERPAGFWFGLGQRTYLAGNTEFPLSQVRVMQHSTAAVLGTT